MIAALRREEDGLTLIEVMIALVVLTVGLLATLSVLTSANKLTLVSEQRQTMAHLAQRELERLQAIPYNELALASAPAHSAQAESPDHYVDYSTPLACTPVGTAGCFAYDVKNPAGEEPLVVAEDGACTSAQEAAQAECGKVAATPQKRSCAENPVGACEWSAGKMSGEIYDFVTWQQDPVCENEALCSAQSYKRVTVAVTVNTAGGAQASTPAWSSILIPNPNAAPKGKSVAESNEICHAGKTECIGIAVGKTQTWILHDTPVEGSEPTGENHEVHPTVAANGECSTKKHGNRAGCPKPDLMNEVVASNTTLYNYSTDLGTTPTEYAGGRVLEGDVACPAAAPTRPANAKEQLWASEPLPSELKLTGAGGFKIFTQVLTGQSTQVALCMALYELPETFTSMTGGEAAKEVNELAWIEYHPALWPTTMEEVSHSFQFPKATLKSGSRLGLRMWITPTSGKIAVAYDVANSTQIIDGQSVQIGDESLLELNTE